MNDAEIAEALQELAKLLDFPDSDCWYDYAAEVAEDIISRDEHTLLPLILEQCRGWNPNMQEHLACILGGFSSPAELHILLYLADSSNEEVAWRARETIRSDCRSSH